MDKAATEKTGSGSMLFAAKPTDTENHYGIYRRSTAQTRKRLAVMAAWNVLILGSYAASMLAYWLNPAYAASIDNTTRPFLRMFERILPFLGPIYAVLLLYLWRKRRKPGYWESEVDTGEPIFAPQRTKDALWAVQRQGDGEGIRFSEIEAYDTWLKVFTPQGPKSFRRIRYDTLVVVWITKDVIILRSCTGPDIDDVTDVMIDRHSFTEGTPDAFIAQLQPYLRHAKTSYKGKSEGVRQTSRWADPNYFFKQRHVKQFGLHTVDLGE